ncbi:MAG: response regulator [Deltaproteobacteria bacterium]|nr:response regulator [Deltaproteobacteria bacterium]
MVETKSYIKGKHILAVDDEQDVLETIEDILDEAEIDVAWDYDSASQKINDTKYDLAILDIMGVDGLRLLDEAVERGIPAVILTAHAINPETLMASIRKGAISYLPKEKLAELDTFLNELLEHCEKGAPPWKLLFEKLGAYFDERFGPNWKEESKDFWSEFDRSYQVSKGAQARLMHDDRVRTKGI